jgi:hypothetical protein
MRIAPIAAAGLLACALATAGAAHADPQAEAQELQQQISELHDSWDTLSPEQRRQRIAQLQQQVTIVDHETRDLPVEQQREIEAPLVTSAFQLADLLMKAQASASPPCVLFVGPPPCGI